MKFLRAVTFFIATLLIYLGVTLLGWGLDDLAGYFSLPPRLCYAMAVGLFSLVFMAVILFRIRDEEAVMLKEFGAEWKAYCKCSWRLIPHLF